MKLRIQNGIEPMNVTMKNLSLVILRLILIVPVVGRANPSDMWTWRNPLPTGNSLHAVVYGNGQFVAGGDNGTILTSPDAVNWIPRQSSTAMDLTAIAFADGLFVVVGGPSGNVILGGGESGG